MASDDQLSPLLCLCLVAVCYVQLGAAAQVELIPKLVRWPTHIDHYLCRQLHTGIGIRSHAVTNINGELCKSYCKIIDRINGKITYTENVTPNFVRCGPNQARCVEGTCVGLNFPTAPGVASPPPPPPSITGESLPSETTIETSEVYNSDPQVVGQVESANKTVAADESSLITEHMSPISSGVRALSRMNEPTKGRLQGVSV